MDCSSGSPPPRIRPPPSRPRVARAAARGLALARRWPSTTWCSSPSGSGSSVGPTASSGRRIPDPRGVEALGQRVYPPPPAPTRGVLPLVEEEYGVRPPYGVGRHPGRRAGGGREHRGPPGGGPRHRRENPRAPASDSGRNPGAAARGEVPGVRPAGELRASSMLDGEEMPLGTGGLHFANSDSCPAVFVLR